MVGGKFFALMFVIGALGVATMSYAQASGLRCFGDHERQFADTPAMTKDLPYIAQAHQFIERTGLDACKDHEQGRKVPDKWLRASLPASPALDRIIKLSNDNGLEAWRVLLAMDARVSCGCDAKMTGEHAKKRWPVQKSARHQHRVNSIAKLLQQLESRSPTQCLSKEALDIGRSLLRQPLIAAAFRKAVIEEKRRFNAEQVCRILKASIAPGDYEAFAARQPKLLLPILSAARYHDEDFMGVFVATAELAQKRWSNVPR